MGQISSDLIFLTVNKVKKTVKKGASTWFKAVGYGELQGRALFLSFLT